MEQNGHTDDTMDGDVTENETIDLTPIVKIEDPTTQPPSEPPGKKLKEHMNRLYGDMSSMITGMETAVQLNFDHYMNKFKPQFWPNLPINI